jgi:predicted GNAT family acetyltransferase
MNLETTRVLAVLEERHGRTRILGTARTGPVLPDIWMIGGVFVDEAQRGKGLGRSVTLALAQEAGKAGADAALYVRPENAPAVAVYRAIGFRRSVRRVFVDSESTAPALT